MFRIRVEMVSLSLGMLETALQDPELVFLDLRHATTQHIQMITKYVPRGLEVLDLGQSDLDDCALVALAQLLAALDSIKEIDLSECQLSREHLECLFVENLFNFPSKSLVWLLSCNAIDDSCMKIIGTALSSGWIKSLDLSQNPISWYGAELLAPFLLGFEALESIDLSETEIGDYGIQVTLLSLKTCCNLRRIMIDHVFKTEMLGLLHIIQFISNDPPVSEISMIYDLSRLVNKEQERNVSDALLEALSRNHHLEELGFVWSSSSTHNQARLLLESNMNELALQRKLSFLLGSCSSGPCSRLWKNPLYDKNCLRIVFSFLPQFPTIYK